MTRWVLALAALNTALHLAVNASDGYGIFRDEYYYLACAGRLAWGYVDQPPLSIFLLFLQRALLGDSLFALRIIPSILGGATVLLGGLIARELGGRAFAQVFAALLVFAVPGYLGAFGYYSMNGIDVFVWTLALWLAARLAGGADPRLWLLLGAVLGLGLLNKIDVLWLGAGIFTGAVLTPWRRQLVTPWPWIGGAIAGLLSVPYVLWQVANGWPTLEFIHNATVEKNVALGPVSFLAGVAMEMNPALSLFWVAGLAALLLWRPLRPHLWAGVCWLTVIAILLASGSAKPYYANASFPVVIAAAAVLLGSVVERGGVPSSRARPAGSLPPVDPSSGGLARSGTSSSGSQSGHWRRWIGALAVLYVAGAFLFVLPFALPVLSPERFVAWSRALGTAPQQQERSTLGDLPQFYADRFGWRELAEEVARVYRELPAPDREDAVIYTTNYGRAGALEYYAAELGLPPVICGHNSYWYWGPGNASGRVVIVVDDEPMESLLQNFEQVETVGMKRCTFCMPYENEVPIRVCRNHRVPIPEIWPEVRHLI